MPDATPPRPLTYQGGTFWYCPWNCWRGKRRSRFRTAKTARRHARRHHA